jgi:translocation and assembly module TamA
MKQGTKAPARTPNLMNPVRRARPVRARLVLLLAGLLAVSGPAAALIRVEVTGVDSTVRRNVLALLSLERYQDRDRIEPDAVARLFRRVDGEVRAALRPFGYYEPVIQATLTAEDEQRNWHVQIDIRPGEPVLLQEVSIVIRGAGASDPVFEHVAAGHTLVKGARLEHAAYEKVKTDLQSAAATFGYLDARLLRNELQVDPAARRASAVLELDTGERYSFGTTTIEQSAIREPQLRRYLRYRDGEPYDAGKLLRTQFALDDSQFFSSIEVVPGERDPVKHIVPIRISGAAGRNTYAFGAGYDDRDGARGTISWLDPRVNDRGHRFRVQIQASELTRDFNARYDIPFGDPVLEKFSLQFLTQTQHISGGVDTREATFRPIITQSFGHWQRTLALNLTHTTTSDIVNGSRVDDLVVPAITYAAVPEGYLGEDLFSRTLYAELLGSHGVLGSNASFLRLDVRSERVLNLSERWHLLLRGEAGTSAVSNFEKLPGIYRFYAGGDRSVRGFAFEELSPVDIRATPDPVTGLPVTLSVRAGGRHLLTGTVEFERDLPRNFGVAAFTDFGNAFDRISSLQSILAVSVGVGFRWRLPVVTVGIDLAKALHDPWRDAIPGSPQPLPGLRLHLNISPRL